MTVRTSGGHKEEGRGTTSKNGTTTTPASHHLEGHGERGEALREEPHQGVGDPNEEKEPSHLAVEGLNLRATADDGDLEGAGDRHEGTSEADEGDEEPEPLHGGHDGHAPHVGGEDVHSDSTNGSADGGGVSVGNNAEEENKEGEGDEPIRIAGIEELPAASDGSPALTGEHSEISHGTKAGDIGGTNIIA
eukprot:CAMPEP_0113699710 /NCGR_PEP_ID=MMETSP0038_2-20120614/23496_1 /TAXON_ID=2898 /ORGANISM="Cryptomonas paramecium" /LENGTH=190 /DNA_ID=CAMNT_0000623173 /DNA_START=684 /DNA_END=1254 /DNA_ORIENTATION=+ /assembly_acc=CAM_ASM_000170